MSRKNNRLLDKKKVVQKSKIRIPVPEQSESIIRPKKGKWKRSVKYKDDFLQDYLSGVDRSDYTDE